MYNTGYGDIHYNRTYIYRYLKYEIVFPWYGVIENERWILWKVSTTHYNIYTITTTGIILTYSQLPLPHKPHDEVHKYIVNSMLSNPHVRVECGWNAACITYIYCTWMYVHLFPVWYFGWQAACHIFVGFIHRRLDRMCYGVFFKSKLEWLPLS